MNTKLHASRKNMQQSLARLEQLQDEISRVGTNWRSIQSQWRDFQMPSPDPGSPSAVANSRETYLSHIMADSFPSSGPAGSKCLFDVALREMTNTVERNPRRTLNLPTVETNALYANGGDKYCLELAEDSSDQGGSVPEFSRFLLGLAGESGLAQGQDPVRFSEKCCSGPKSGKFMHDRIIR